MLSTVHRPCITSPTVAAAPNLQHARTDPSPQAPPDLSGRNTVDDLTLRLRSALRGPAAAAATPPPRLDLRPREPSFHQPAAAGAGLSDVARAKLRVQAALSSMAATSTGPSDLLDRLRRGGPRATAPGSLPSTAAAAAHGYLDALQSGLVAAGPGQGTAAQQSATAALARYSAHAAALAALPADGGGPEGHEAAAAELLRQGEQALEEGRVLAAGRLARQAHDGFVLAGSRPGQARAARLLRRCAAASAARRVARCTARFRVGVITRKGFVKDGRAS
jgi:hypothetical protein